MEQLQIVVIDYILLKVKIKIGILSLKRVKKCLRKETEQERLKREFDETYKPYVRENITYVKNNPLYLTEKDIGRWFRVRQGAVCEHSVHEWNNYPRYWIKIERLYPGEEVRFEGFSTNMYGSHATFITNKGDHKYYIDNSIVDYILEEL